MTRLVKNYNKGFVSFFSRDFKINEDLIAEITGLSIDATQIYKDRKFSENVVKLFPKEKKENKNYLEMGWPATT